MARRAPVIIAVGVNSIGRREVLGMDIGPSEAKPFWTAFLREAQAAWAARHQSGRLQRARLRTVRVHERQPGTAARADSVENQLGYNHLPEPEWQKRRATP